MSDTTTADAPLTEAMIAGLVRRFYDSARADEVLGPLFAAAVENWDAHYVRVQDFWSHALLGTDRYGGGLFRAHMALPIEMPHFERWMGLFQKAAAEELPAAHAARAVARAKHSMQSLKVGLFLPDGTPARKPH